MYKHYLYIISFCLLLHLREDLVQFASLLHLRGNDDTVQSFTRLSRGRAYLCEAGCCVSSRTSPIITGLLLQQSRDCALMQVKG